MLRLLERNYLIETILGFAIPAAHTQPTWPISMRFNLEAFTDPSRRFAAVVTSAAIVLGAVSILGGILSSGDTGGGCSQFVP